MDGPFTISATDATDEVFFECLDGALVGTDTIVCGLGELPLASFFLEVCLDMRCGLIVSDIECWFKSFLCQLGNCFVECSYDGFVDPIFLGVAKM